MAKATSGKKDIKKLSEKLTYRPPLVWDAIGTSEKGRAFSFAEDYKTFLDEAKTEREAVACIQKHAGAAGFVEIPSPGSRKPLFKTLHGKAVALARPGRRPLRDGIRLIISHIDAPRLDLKQKPLYEEVDLAFFKTHYYGGIKKFQWLARPLSIHGCIIKADGRPLDLTIGEDPGDPVFTILDLLPHLARKAQYVKKLDQAIEGEKLNVIVGGLPLGDRETKDRFKLAVLNHLFERYAIVEEDLVSAELEVVPADKARDVGWDRALVGAYGQDDRICAFASLRAFLDVKRSDCGTVVLFVDKEEIGSDGATGAKSKFLESVLWDMAVSTGEEPGPQDIAGILARSRALSGDVTGALDPDYQEVHEKRNAARMGYGVCMTKFTGHGGKVGASDANAEYVGWLRRLFNRQKVVWQTGELGKIDEGGGGTVAKFLAVYGMEIIDCGPPILSMHSPFEIAHKGDLYMTYKGFRAFLEEPSE
ncbi:MAG: aminopeptidase [Deltaproteobacteria bacterium]|nr:aminopeptidase [Deltaproteobacteria bacterium]